MKPGRILRAVAEAGIGFAWGEDGSVFLIDPDHKLTHLMLTRLMWDRWLIDGALLGVMTGHRWMACDTCDEVALLSLDRSRQPRPCHLTQKCPGLLSRVPLWLPRRPRRQKEEPNGNRPPTRGGKSPGPRQRRPSDFYLPRADVDWSCVAARTGARDIPRPRRDPSPSASWLHRRLDDDELLASDDGWLCPGCGRTATTFYGVDLANDRRLWDLIEERLHERERPSRVLLVELGMEVPPDRLCRECWDRAHPNDHQQTKGATEPCT